MANETRRVQCGWRIRLDLKERTEAHARELERPARWLVEKLLEEALDRLDAGTEEGDSC